MASDSQSKDSKKIADVAQPGATGPTATAKPVIVGHGNMIKEDPMVASAKTTETAPMPPKDTPESLTARAEKVISAPEVEASNQEEVTKPDTSDKKDSDAGTEQNQESSQDRVATSEQAAVDAVAKQADKDKKNRSEPTEEEKNQAVAIQKLIDDKKYFVSVSASRSQRKTMHLLLIMLLLVVVAFAVVYLLIDAEVLDVGVTLPIEFLQ